MYATYVMIYIYIHIYTICIWLQPILFSPVRLLQGPPIRKDSSIEGSQDDSEEGSEEEGEPADGEDDDESLS